jgi:hypothetical protein
MNSKPAGTEMLKNHETWERQIKIALSLGTDASHDPIHLKFGVGISSGFLMLEQT